VMHKMVNGLLSNLRCLEELRMNCYVENSTLGILGQSCPKLKHLNISGSKGVTNQGIFHLCPGHIPEAGCCTNIEYLDVSNTGVGLMGGVHALASLPKLKVLKHNCTYSVIKAFRERHKSKSLPCLQVLQITELPFRARFATSEHLKNVRIFPN
jgi:triphosphoribosyl-dephospho-CoA synthetase